MSKKTMGRPSSSAVAFFIVTTDTIADKTTPVCSAISSGRLDDPGILPSREMRRLRHPAREEELVQFQMRHGDPVGDRVPRLLSDFNWTGRWVFFCMTMARGATRLPWATS